MARAFTYTAIGYDRAIAVNSPGGIELFELFTVFEGAVFLAGHPPGYRAGSGNVSAALAGFRQAGRGENLAAEFLRAADVDHVKASLAESFLHLGQEAAQGVVGFGGGVVRRLRFRGVG